jgi:hypothetical protein
LGWLALTDACEFPHLMIAPELMPYITLCAGNFLDLQPQTHYNLHP